MRRNLTTAILMLAMAVSVPGAAAAAAPQSEAALDATALARKTQNPVGDLLSLTLQLNFNNGGAYGDETIFLLNFQPVLPFSASDDWNVIARPVLPYYNFPSGPQGDRSTGLGDLQLQLYVTPRNPGRFIWGIGPVLSFPIATNDLVATGSWAIGPGAVLLSMAGPWVLGGLVNQYWTYSDHGGAPEVNLLVVQPFINFNFGKGWALSLAPLITGNFDAPDGQEWTVPLGFGITRTTAFNKRPVNVAIQYYANVERPDAGPGNQLRILVAPLYPR